MSTEKQEFEMSQEEFENIKAIAQRPATPVMKFGDYVSGFDKQEDANSVWRALGDKYGFIWDTAEGVSGKGPTFFKATPKQSQ